MSLISNIETGTRTKTQTVNASAIRTQKTFEVIDYDSLDKNYALIYKSIEISHEQTFKQSANGTGTGGYSQPGWGILDLVCPAPFVYNTIETSVALRSITYKLHCKIVTTLNGIDTVTLVKKDLATCSVSANESVQSLSGNRIYSPSIQISEKYITYSYEYDIVLLTNPNVNAVYKYDGAMSLEDWNYDDDKSPIWQRTKHVVGLVNINDGSGSDVGHDGTREYATTGEAINQVPFPSQQYSVGEAEI